jgi:hypothetical protein
MSRPALGSGGGADRSRAPGPPVSAVAHELDLHTGAGADEALDIVVEQKHPRLMDRAVWGKHQVTSLVAPNPSGRCVPSIFISSFLFALERNGLNAI